MVPNVSLNDFFSRGLGKGFETVGLCPGFEGCGLGAKCGNRGHRPRLQRRLCRLCRCLVFGFFVAVGR